MLKITNTSKDIAFAILIGGKSTRFGSDKGLYTYQRKPLISHIIETVQKGSYDIFLIAHSTKQIQKYINTIDIKKIIAFILDDRVVLSNSKLHIPLLGMYSAFKELNKLGYKQTFTLSCDTPLIKYEVIDFIIKESKEVECCIPRWNNGYIEPLLAIYPTKGAYYRSKEKLLRKKYQLTRFADNKWNTKYLSIENSIKPLDNELISFVNINTQNDLKKLTVA
ncbi:MAG: molybdenum cofactor guanylyltransferase [Promethearchaeota archaeon]